ncbi:hypothetical protein ACLMJK_005530 [Lecanora helva]
MAYNPLAQGELDALSDSDYSQIAASPVDDLEAVENKRGRRSPNLDLGSPYSYSDAMDPHTTVSREGSVLRHPAPDSQSIQRAYISNVERLEQSAERLSLSSSGIGEEIRKMREEQRKSDSRRSSVLHSPADEDERCQSLNRQTSYYGSRASSSIVGTNNIARSGGFSPAAYFASPRGSVRSGSWSQHASVKERSASYGPRLTQVSEPEQEGKPLDSPLSSRLVPLNPDPEPPSSPLRVVNNENFNLDDIEIPHTQSEITDMIQDPDPRPSTDTHRQASGLFADFDGVHTDHHSEGQSDVPPNASRRVSGQSRPTSRIMSYIEPSPGENMVYYPAPVPMMLNLPKRLSKLPQSAEREKRRTQILGNLPGEARKSAAWLPDMHASSDGITQPDEGSVTNSQTSKRRTMADIPPQLRATMFFDQPSVPHDIELKGDSAVDTLDSILDASAYAPVSAFTDHPFAGRAGAEVYSKEISSYRASALPSPQKRRSTINLLSNRNSGSDQIAEGRKSPNVLRKRNSSLNMLEKTRSRNSSVLSLGNFGKRRSGAQQIEDAEEHHEIEAAEQQGEEAPLRTPDKDHEAVGAEDTYFQDASEQPEEHAHVEDEGAAVDEFNGAPTTLLAELQMRKAQQKLRNRTAATAFPNGMHSTLLQLDAVDQVQKQRRKQKHTKLAWEDPNAHHPGVENEDDEDVPLGVLFAGRQLDNAEKARRMDEDRPLGLIAKREREDNEPLSHRRARLRGEDPLARQYTLDLPDFGNGALEDKPQEAAVPINNETENENENETLGQRLRRLKATQIPVQPRPVSGDFASEMMSQFGAPSPSAQTPQASNPTQTPDPEETLGQRRRRLQAEAAANGKPRQPSGGGGSIPNNVDGASSPPTHQQPSKRRSLADILSAHPAAGAGTSSARALSNEIKFAPAPKTRNTSWAINQTRQASMGVGMSMASGLGGMGNGDVYANGNGSAVFVNPMVGKQQVGGNLNGDEGRREMIDRWRQSVHY